MAEPEMASATTGIKIAGGQTNISKLASPAPFSFSAKPPAKAFASAVSMFIFQLPAIKVRRALIVLPPIFGCFQINLSWGEFYHRGLKAQYSLGWADLAHPFKLI